MLVLEKKSLAKKEVLDGAATASSFVAKFRDEVFAHFHVVVVKRYSSMRN
jgi:hypothetical protein